MSGVFQIRRGLSTSRPNPLNIGEFGWDTDTNQLWIGNGVLNQNLFVAGALATTDFSIYIATTALGGRAASAGADGLKMVSGTATATTANKLVDGAASFDSTHLNKTVYNSTLDKWAKVTAVDSATQLSLSADIMVSGNAYEIANAFDNVAEAWAAVPSPFGANITLQNSSGTFTGTVNAVGKTPVGTKTITWQGDATGAGTTISGAVILNNTMTVNDVDFTGTVDTSSTITMSRDTFAGVLTCGYGTLLTWDNCTVMKKITTENGADLTWDNCNTTGTAKLFIQLGSKNLIKNSTVTVGNDPTNITSISSTITTGYTMYVATSALGGDDTVADGLEMASGSATSTTANKLVDSGANFDSTLLNKTVYNPTDDTWAKVTAVDSTTQLSLSADIMASGESYVISNAWSTVQGGVDAVPGTVNCNTTVRISDGTFAEDVVIRGKALSGNYTITVIGTLSLLTTAVGATVAGGSATVQGTVTKTGAFGTYDNKLAYLVTDAVWRGIDSDTADVLTLFGAAPSSTTQDVKVYGWGTVVDRITAGAGQIGLFLDSFDLIRTTSYALLGDISSNTTILRSRIREIIVSGSVLVTTYCYCYQNTSRVIHNVGGNHVGGNSKFQGGAGVDTILAEQQGKEQAFSGSIIDGGGSGSGFWIITNSVCNHAVLPSEGYVRVRNNTNGCFAQTGGMIFGTANTIYSGNTVNENAEAASYGYID